MYYREFNKILHLILKDAIRKDEILNYLLENIDCEIIYDLDDMLMSDIYFSLKHYASGEENIKKVEWEYFLDCLNGKIKYDMNDKLLLK